MSVVGMFSGGAGQADDGVGCDSDETAGLSDAVALGQVLEDGDGGWCGEPAAVQRRALAFGEAGAAAMAIQASKLLVLAVAAADGEITDVTLAVECAVGVLAAEASEVVHEADGPGGPGRETIRGWKRKTSLILRRIPHYGSTDLRHHRSMDPRLVRLRSPAKG
jgi:hypothetical protein